VGSNSLGDSRLLPAQTVKPLSNWAQAVGVSAASTTSATAVPLVDMICIIKTTGNPVEIFYSVSSYGAGGSEFTTQVYVNGVAVGGSKRSTGPTTNYSIINSDSLIVPLSPGVHIVTLMWSTTSSLMTNAGRSLKVREL